MRYRAQDLWCHGHCNKCGVTTCLGLATKIIWLGLEKKKKGIPPTHSPQPPGELCRF